MKHVLSPLIIATSASAHAIFQQFYVNGVTPGHLVAMRAPNYEGPLVNLTSDDIICNGGLNPYYQPISNVVYDVHAGSTFTAQWHHTIVGAIPGDSDEPIETNHKGPITSYMAKVHNATDLNATGLAWFKIYEDGLDVPTQAWAVDRMIANGGLVNFTIPACIEPGQYLLRHEVLALQTAATYPGAQFYMSCAQINVVGHGRVKPAGVAIPGAFHSTDPGITFNLYQDHIANYTIPGPDVFNCTSHHF